LGEIAVGAGLLGGELRRCELRERLVVAVEGVTGERCERLSQSRLRIRLLLAREFFAVAGGGAFGLEGCAEAGDLAARGVHVGLGPAASGQPADDRSGGQHQERDEQGSDVHVFDAHTRVRQFRERRASWPEQPP
jgi:hypothetical protein